MQLFQQLRYNQMKSKQLPNGTKIAFYLRTCCFPLGAYMPISRTISLLVGLVVLAASPTALSFTQQELIDAILGRGSFTELELAEMDVNEDGVIDVADIRFSFSNSVEVGFNTRTTFVDESIGTASIGLLAEGLTGTIAYRVTNLLTNETQNREAFAGEAITVAITDDALRNESQAVIEIELRAPNDTSYRLTESIFHHVYVVDNEVSWIMQLQLPVSDIQDSGIETGMTADVPMLLSIDVIEVDGTFSMSTPEQSGYLTSTTDELSINGPFLSGNDISFSISDLKPASAFLHGKGITRSLAFSGTLDLESESKVYSGTFSETYAAETASEFLLSVLPPNEGQFVFAAGLSEGNVADVNVEDAP